LLGLDLRFQLFAGFRLGEFGPARGPLGGLFMLLERLKEFLVADEDLAFGEFLVNLAGKQVVVGDLRLCLFAGRPLGGRRGVKVVFMSFVLLFCCHSLKEQQYLCQSMAGGESVRRFRVMGRKKGVFSFLMMAFSIGGV